MKELLKIPSVCDFSEFPEQNAVLGADQKEYTALPCHRVNSSPERHTIVCVKLSLKQRLLVLFTGKVWITTLTFGQLFQPLLVEVKKPFGRWIFFPRSKSNDR